MASRYEALTRVLAMSTEPVVVMTFAELDGIVGALPASARKCVAWWANSSSAQPHARYWLDANRRAIPDLRSERVRFELGVEPALTSKAAVDRRDRETDLLPTGEAVTTTVRFAWSAAGSVLLDSTSKPAMPKLPARPGIYRFTLRDDEDEIVGVYIGESDNLARRMGNYRNPGSGQPTNQRVNQRILVTLEHGGSVELAVAVEVTADGEDLDLARRPARLLAENLALIQANQAAVPVENL